jgi:DNA segregation ATPase FtsK/SpoIIIE-like protein
MALRWLPDELERRYVIMAKERARNIERHNQIAGGEQQEILPYVVVDRNTGKSYPCDGE